MKATDFNIYHIFTMGFTGAEALEAECTEQAHRLYKVEKMMGYLEKLGVNTLLLGPLFSSISHGYDTTDYYQVDRRIGTNDDLRALVEAFHKRGFKVIIDCVFNHVGREFFAFKELQENRENARYKDWFLGVNFWGNNSYNDGFSYENWAGCDNLVKLNLWNPEVSHYLKTVMAFWMDTFLIDGVRMDAANVMDRGFLSALSAFAKEKNPDFWMQGEMVGGDYGVLVREGKLDSVTNYESYKGLYSSLNTKNYFEIAYSLNRLFGTPYGLYRDFLTTNFVDNHDVNRVASTLDNEAWLSPLYLMLYTMPGIPSIYYGGEQGIKGVKGDCTDAPLRPNYESMHFDETSALYRQICRMGAIRKALKALREGSYQELFVKPQQMGFLRECDGEQVIVLFNSEDKAVSVEQDILTGTFKDLYQDKLVEATGSVEIPACSGCVLVLADQAPEIMLPEREKSFEGHEDAGAFEVEEIPQTMQQIMALALEEAEKGAAEGEVPIGAVILCEGEVLARAHNLKEKLQDPTAHAEMLVIREAAKKLGSWRLSECELYVTAEPCPMCMGAVIQSRLKKLVYGTYEKRFGGVETTAHLGNHPMLSNATEIYSGICEEACQTVLTNFFEKNRD